MREQFVFTTLKRLVDRGFVHPSDSIIAVCAGKPEHGVLQRVGFTNVLLTNLDPQGEENEFVPYAWSRQDASQLSFVDDSFDFAFVSDGLHHCSSPHRALLEMYRVARKGVIVFESRDNILMRIAVMLGLAAQYETRAVQFNGGVAGGVNNSQVPNFVYRWTEREFEKTILAFFPAARHRFDYFYGLNQSPLFRYPRKSFKRLLVQATAPLVRLFVAVFPRQGNSFAMVAMKPHLPDDLWPWLTMREGALEFRLPRG